MRNGFYPLDNQSFALTYLEHWWKNHASIKNALEICCYKFKGVNPPYKILMKLKVFLN